MPGLRIAPPEAPVTGYMFGKGVYFADMFSKSANYCYSSPTAASGVLLLCEVLYVLFFILFAIVTNVISSFPSTNFLFTEQHIFTLDIKDKIRLSPK